MDLYIVGLPDMGHISIFWLTAHFGGKCLLYGEV